MKHGFMKKHTITSGNWRTSVSLEREFWEGLQGIARKKSIAVYKLVSLINGMRQPRQGLSSAIRVYVLQEAMNQCLSAQTAAPNTTERDSVNVITATDTRCASTAGKSASAKQPTYG